MQGASGADSEQKSHHMHLDRNKLLNFCKAGNKEELGKVIDQLREADISLEAPHLQEFFVECLWMAQKGGHREALLDLILPLLLPAQSLLAQLLIFPGDNNLNHRLSSNFSVHEEEYVKGSTPLLMATEMNYKNLVE